MFKSAATKIAHNSTIPALAGNRDIRPLQDLITAEKAVIVSLQKLSVDFSKSSEALRAWGLGEGDDLGDILAASTSILTHFSSALSQYAAHGHTMREHLKSIRSREEGLEDLKRRRRNVMSKAEAAEKKLSKMSPEHKNLPQQSDLLNRLREEIRGLDVEIMREEAALGDFKRSTTRTWVGLKFGGLLEFCEKGVIAGGYGKLVVAEIPEDITEPGLPRVPYHGHAKVEHYVAEAHGYVNDVRLSTVAPSQSRSAEHQLPQVHSMSDSPFMPQEPFSGQHPLDSYYDVSQGYDQQNLGNSRLHDGSDPTTSAFSSPQHQPQYSGSLSSASAMQPGMRRIDEFGSPTGPVDNSISTGGGRFATFPVRQNRSESIDIGNTNANIQLPSMIPIVTPEQEGSFASSVVQALSGSSQSDTSPSTTQTAQPGRLSRDGPAPAYESDVGHASNPWANQQQLSPNNQIGPTHTRALSNLSEDDVQLSYMTTSHDDPQDMHDGHGGDDDRHASRHVRFGDVRDIDSSTTSAIPPSPLVSAPSEQPYAQSSRSAEEQAPLSPSDQLRHMLDGTRPDESASANRAGRPNRVPVPRSLDDERALDAAAARGIALEMNGGSGRPSISNDDTPTTSPPPPVIVEPETTSQPSGNNGSHTQIPSPKDDVPSPLPSPLAPPSPGFMGRRSVSPRPDHESSPGSRYDDIGVIPSSPLSTPYDSSYMQHHQQAPSSPYPQDRFSSSLGSNQPPQHKETYTNEPSSYAREYNPYEETQRSQAPPQINLPIQSSSPLAQYGSYPYESASSPRSEFYPTPPEQSTLPLNVKTKGPGTSPLSSALSSPSQSQSPYLKSTNMGTSNTARSTSSLNISPGGGTGGGGGGSGTGKKISAAAFKRPSPRLGSGSSPFSIPGPTSEANKKQPPPHGDSDIGTEHKLPPYQPLAQQHQQGSGNTSQRRDTSEFDGSQYDYISAYVNSGDEQERGGIPPGPGGYYYEQGQGQGGYYGQGGKGGQGGHY